MVLGTRLVVGFDGPEVGGALVRHGLGGARVRRLATEPLPAGALTPSALEANLARPGEVAQALARLRGALGGNGRRATLVLPDAVARLQLVDVPKGTAAAEYARFRLAPGLPYPVAEARVAVLPLGTGRVLAGAVRRAIVQEYEAAAGAAGLAQREITLAAFAALAGLKRTLPAGLALLLGETTATLLALRGGEVVASRLRHRDASSATRLVDEARRTAAWAGLAEPVTVAVVGRRAAAAAEALASGGLAARAGWGEALPDAPPEAADSVWLGGACS